VTFLGIPEPIHHAGIQALFLVEEHLALTMKGSALQQVLVVSKENAVRALDKDVVMSLETGILLITTGTVVIVMMLRAHQWVLAV